MSAKSREPLFDRARRRLRGVDAGRSAPTARGTSPDPRPDYPHVAEEPTNVGPAMDAIVTRVRRNQKPVGVDADYDLLREHFDHLNFMLQAPGLLDERDLDPIATFLRSGARATNSPDYNFSMRNYLDRNPERKQGTERSPYLEWLKRGRAAGEIADPAQGIRQMAEVLGLEPAEVVDELVATRTDMMERLRTGKLGEMFAKAAELDPLIASAWPETARTRMIPLQGKFVSGAIAAIYASQKAAGFKRARLVVVTDRPRRRGSRRLEEHLAHSLAETVDAHDIVVIYTDQGGSSPQGRFPAGAREVDFAAAADGLPDEHRQQAFVSLLRSFRADAIVNIDSRLLYAVMTPYGKALAASERIFLCFFVPEPRAQGHVSGPPQEFFYPFFDLVEGVITDSDHLRDQLTEMYQLSEADRERIHVFPAPVEPGPSAAVPVGLESPHRPVVYWAGRWDPQQPRDIALEVARRIPDVDFRFWGEPRSGDPSVVPENVRLEGPYDDLARLDLSQVDAWLYTSAQDGVPSLLLEVAMTEIPVVASMVGGVGEVLSSEDAWPVTDWQSPEAYEKALREILSDPAAARLRSRALRDRLRRDRTQSAYREYAARVLLDRTSPAEEAPCPT
jgi:glycosyltransferase involved in cell wall biosynthesis